MLILGVDGGGTKTAGLAVNERGQVVGWGIGKGSNYHVLGLDGMLASVSGVVRDALKGNATDSVCYCLAAADMPHDFVVLREKLNELDFIPSFTVRNDVIGIFRAGSRFPYGVGVVCGTGFNAGGISQDGVEFRLPALGAFTGDYAGGGGEHVSVRGIGSGFRSWDGRGEKTLLEAAVLKHFSAYDYETLAEMYVQRRVTAPMIRSFAPMVFEMSAAGDAVAQEIIRDEGTELGVGANAILRWLNLTDTDCDVVLGGSMTFGKGNLLMDTVREVVHKQSPRAKVKRLDVPPVVGAVLLAADSIGLTVDEAFVGAIKDSLPDELRVPKTVVETDF